MLVVFQNNRRLKAFKTYEEALQYAEYKIQLFAQSMQYTYFHLNIKRDGNNAVIDFGSKLDYYYIKELDE